MSVGVYAQNITVKGHVKDATGLEVIGANVVEKGNTSNGTITDLDGNFTLTVPKRRYINNIFYWLSDTRGGSRFYGNGDAKR